MTVNFATGLPDNYGGISVYSRSAYAAVSAQTPNFTAIMNAYSANTEILFDHPPCGDSCSAKTRVGYDVKFEVQKLMKRRAGIRISSKLLSRGREHYRDCSWTRMDQQLF
jgi:hypothetical protein